MRLKQKELIDYYLGGFLIAVLKPVFLAAGKLLGIDHSPLPKGDIVIMKLLGGGSLILALPALLGIRKRFSGRSIHLVTTPAILPFAETLSLFDQIHIIDDSGGALKLISSALKTIRSIFLIDTFIDLEIHSRLSTIFSGLSAARNRIGFYLRDVFWRKDIQSHLVFFNPAANVYYEYKACAEIIGASPASFQESRDHLRKSLSAVSLAGELPEGYMVMGHTCSDLSLERMLSPRQWKTALKRLIKENIISRDIPVVFLGTARDFDKAEAITREIGNHLKNPFINLCGKYRLIESIKIISGARYFAGIDSSLLHYARILGVPSTSYWGPTNPASLMLPLEDYQEEVFYSQIPCSPCVHITETPPCNGKAFCIESLFKEDHQEKEFTLIYNPDTSAGL